MKKVTDIIRELREDKDLKQSDIAAALQITQQKYSSYETGRNETPLDILTALADYHDVSTDFLLGRTSSRQGVGGLNKKIAAECSVGELLSDVLSLGEPRRKSVIEYVRLQKLDEKNRK